MVTKAAKKGPSGKYHKTGLHQLRALIDDFKNGSANERSAGKISFSNQVGIISCTHIPAYHEPWRAAIRKGAEVFGESGEDYVAEALANLLAGERAARAKRKAKADEKASSAPKSARPDSLRSRGHLSPDFGRLLRGDIRDQKGEPPAVAIIPQDETATELPCDIERK